MPASCAVDITELALGIHFADTVAAVNEKDVTLVIGHDAGRRVSRTADLGKTEQGQPRDDSQDYLHCFFRKLSGSQTS